MVRASSKDGNDIVVPVYAEELSVERRQVVQGGVRVEVTTAQHDHLVREVLTDEHVEIARLPVGRVVDVMPEVRQEGDTTIIPVMEERLVVERRLVLKEEIHLRRVSTARAFEQSVKLRAQKADIERTGREAPDAADANSTEWETKS